MSFYAYSMFCEDIRNEVAGTESLIGILPEHVQFKPSPVPGAPSKYAPSFPKLAIYTRIFFTFDDEPEFIDLFIVDTDGKILARNPVPSEVIKDAVVKGGPLNMATIKITLIAQNLPLAGPGLFCAIIKTNKLELTSGAISVTMLELEKPPRKEKIAKNHQRLRKQAPLF